MAALGSPRLRSAIAFAVLVALAAGISVSAQTANEAQQSGSTLASYADSASGLDKLFNQLIKLEKGGDKATLEAYAQSMQVPVGTTWFTTVFGDDLGGEMASASLKSRDQQRAYILTEIESLVAAKLTDVHAVRFDDACTFDASAVEYPFLLLRKTREPLYSVRLSNGDKTVLWHYFAYIDGAFRYIGGFEKRQMTSRAINHDSAKPTPRVQRPGAVQAASLIHQVTPIYPTIAKQNGVQGNVIFDVVIGKDGTVQDMDLIQGQCYLAEAASDAVKQWRYSPLLLNGEPTEVRTEITVVFQLGH